MPAPAVTCQSLSLTGVVLQIVFCISCIEASESTCRRMPCGKIPHRTPGMMHGPVAGNAKIANNAAPAAVNDAGDAARSIGIDTKCDDGSVTANACQAVGGADAVNNAAASAVNQGVQAATDAVSGQDSSNDSASSSSSPPPSSSGGSCCCWDTKKKSRDAPLPGQFQLVRLRLRVDATLCRTVW